MKAIHLLPKGILSLFFLFVAQLAFSQTTDSIVTCRAVVIDKSTGNPLSFAGISVDGTNYSTITNTDGEFLLKLSPEFSHSVLNIQYLGYKLLQIAANEISSDKYKIELEPVAVELPEVSVISKDAESLVLGMLERKGENYPTVEEHLTAFYRETIRKNKSYVSLSEAVVDVYKQSYNSYKSDIVNVYKARKKTDYNKLDTLVFKLMGGPFNSLYLDVFKHPTMIFTDEITKNYDFSFDRSTRIGKRLLYVIDFKQKETVEEPLYYGKLYIDAQTLALKTAIFKLNLQNKTAAARLFIVKKPINAEAYPVEASYRIDYIEKDKKWYYGYSRIELGLRVNWKKKLFNTTFMSVIELATTNREKSEYDKDAVRREKIRPNIVIADEVSGFADPNFWGEFNLIEPEKPIETAIRKIQKQLEKK